MPAFIPEVETIYTSDLYRMPLNNLVHRTTGTWSRETKSTFRLLKIHGSINWYFSGYEGFPGEQVYYTEIDSPLPETDYESESELLKINRIGLSPLIIPPVAEKSSFYDNTLIKSLWTTFYKAISDADEIYCVGYSLPETDLSLSLFLSSTVGEGNKRVYLVNTAKGKEAEELILNYRKYYHVDSVDNQYLGLPNAVQKMVVDLCNSP